MLAGLGIAGAASAEEVLREVYFHDLAKTRVGNMIIVQSNPETEMLVFNGGELTLEGGNLIVVARHARIDGDTIIRAFTQTTRLPKPGQPNQAARGVDGMKEARQRRQRRAGRRPASPATKARPPARSCCASAKSPARVA